MLNNAQISTLAMQNKIDKFTIIREYVQIRFLTELYQLSHPRVIFKGGTALRLIYASPRYSEDLDFDALTGVSEIEKCVNQVVGHLKRELPEIEVINLQSLVGLSFKIYLTTPVAAQKLTVKLDFSFREQDQKSEVEKRPIQSAFPIQSYVLIGVHSRERILADKICTLFTRFKGRDLYDTWYLLNSGTTLNYHLAQEKLMRLFALSFSKEVLISKINKFDHKKLEQDLNKYLPLNQRNIVPLLKNLVLEKLG